MEGVRIVQIYLNMDLRNGDAGLGAFLMKRKGLRRKDLRVGEVFVFFNRRRNIVKVMSKDSILQQRLDGNKTWDLKLRKDQLFELIGKAFGLTWNISRVVYSEAQKVAEATR